MESANLAEFIGRLLRVSPRAIGHALFVMRGLGAIARSASAPELSARVISIADEAKPDAGGCTCRQMRGTGRQRGCSW